MLNHASRVVQDCGCWRRRIVRVKEGSGVDVESVFANAEDYPFPIWREIGEDVLRNSRGIIRGRGEGSEGVDNSACV